MKNKIVLATSVLLTLAIVVSFAVGPMVNAQPVNPNVNSNVNVRLAALKNSPMVNALKEYFNVMNKGEITELKATITDVVYGNGRLPVELTVKTEDSKEITVLLGPIWMFNATELTLNSEITLKGKLLDSQMVAFEVTFSKGQLVQLRNNEGIPLWPRSFGAQRRPMGNYQAYRNNARPNDSRGMGPRGMESRGMGQRRGPNVQDSDDK